MNITDLYLPPGVDRLSAADFRTMLSGRGPAGPLPVPPAKREAPHLSVALEHEEQVALVQWLRMKGIRYNATPNGGHRAAKTAKWLKAEGVAAGFPDITVWPELGSGSPVLHVEMKRAKGGRATKEQLEWKAYLNSLPGHLAEVCEGACEAIRFISTSWNL